MSIIGERRGRLTVLKFTHIEERGGRKVYYYLCRCDCGNIKEVSGTALATRTRSCGCLKREYSARTRREVSIRKAAERDKKLIGHKFGRLTVVKRGEVLEVAEGKKVNTYICRCDCGTICQVYARNILEGMTHSCGCLRQERTAERARRYWADYRQRKSETNV